MPKRIPVPPNMIGRQVSLINHFKADYAFAVEQEKNLPKHQRYVTRMGPTYAAAGWLLARDQSRRRRKRADTPTE